MSNPPTPPQEIADPPGTPPVNSRVRNDLIYVPGVGIIPNIRAATAGVEQMDQTAASSYSPRELMGV